MFGLFGRKKKYKVKGRILVVENKSKLSKEYIKKITSVLLELFKKEVLLFKFRRLHIVLYDNAKDGRAGEAIEPDIIMINLSHLVDLIGGDVYSSLKKRLKEIIIHEAYHLLHHDMNSALRLFETRCNTRIIEELERLLESIDKPFKNTLEIESRFAKISISSIRTGITALLKKIWIEGLAKFLEGLYNGRLIFDEHTFAQLYSKAKEDMQKIEKSFALIRNALPKVNPSNKATMDRLIQRIDTFVGCVAIYRSYYIGEHIFYAIRYLDPDIDDEQMIRLHIYKLILLYERLMLKHGYQPVISLYSGSGIFDYKRTIKFISLELKKAMET